MTPKSVSRRSIEFFQLNLAQIKFGTFLGGRRGRGRGKSAFQTRGRLICVDVHEVIHRREPTTFVNKDVAVNFTVFNMTATPKKLVHWAHDISLSDFGSPFSNTSSDSVLSTSTLQYINSQLIAHGFTSAPGLSLDGIPNNDSERVVKCLLAMLSQRVVSRRVFKPISNLLTFNRTTCPERKS
jgi:hypothetical protein